MEESSSRHRRQPFKICCYQLDRDDDDRPVIRVTNGPMLNRQQISKIKFQQVNIARQPASKLLSQLYQDTGQDIYLVQTIIKKLFLKRVNPVILSDSQNLERDDLEFYIPQIITYMVIECNLSFKKFNQLVLEACMTDFYFAHSVYFYLESLASTKEGDVKAIRKFIGQQFLPKMEMYEQARLSGCQLTKCRMSKDQNNKISLNQDIEQIFYLDQKNKENYTKKIINQDYCGSGFLSTPKFWTDLVSIGQDISKCQPSQKAQILQQLINQRVKIKLPACVYVPFFKNHYRLYTVLSIKKGFLFSTKQRSPYSIYLQLFRQQQETQEYQNKIKVQNQMMIEKNQKSKSKKNLFDKIYDTLSAPFVPGQGRNTLNLKKISQKNKLQTDDSIKKRVRFRSFYQQGQEVQSPSKKRKVSLSFVYETNSQVIPSSIQSQGSINQEKEQMLKKQHTQNKYFSRRFSQFAQQTRKKSQFGYLKSWKLLHLMVKIGDDLKQEQFAMQLINRFQYIFKKQKVDLFLMPYEVVSLGPDYGLIQMINDVTTLDSLFRKLTLQKKTLRDLFATQFKNVNSAQRNFMRSLAAYSLVTYFLQVKDRHNGNILLHRDGYILHIDFGFLLSNAPGRGVQLQKKVPFKLLTQYVQVLGSLNSQLFIQFRKLFQKGFRAVIKNRQIIIDLVKMMYCAHGQTMACFKRGQQAIQALQQRLNPPPNLTNFCFELVNNSLDHWRARWYDKFQYFLQKIYY